MDAIITKGLSKSYTSRSRARTGATSARKIDVLKDINLRVSENKSLGLLGANGSGKTTLLRVLAGIANPDEGDIFMNATPHTVLGLGHTLNERLSGRQNVWRQLNLEGLNARQIVLAIDEIEEFAELGDYFDQPLRIYSTGMVARLAFSTSLALAPSIILLDEVLSVGDINFCQKALGKIKHMRRQGCTLVVSSHHWPTLMEISEELAILENGEISVRGDSLSVMRLYLERHATEPDRVAGQFEISNVSIDVCDEDYLEVHVCFQNLDPSAQLSMGFNIFRHDSTHRFLYVLKYTLDCPASANHVFRVPTARLMVGNYFLNVHAEAKDPNGTVNLFSHASWANGFDLPFQIRYNSNTNNTSEGVIRPNITWSIT